MKKQLLLLLLLVGTVQTSFATFNVGNWRWRNDNGSETSATWKAAENVPVQITSANEVIRLRVEYANTQATSAVSSNVQINYSMGANGTLYTINENGATNAFVLVGTNTNVTHGTATTKQLVGNSTYSAYTFSPGAVIVNGNILNYNISPQGKAEYEFVIRSTGNIQPGATYYFSFAFGNASSGVPAPSLTVANTLPVKLASFEAKKSNSGVILKWKTESEKDNDRFEIERSIDGKKWSVIGKIFGKGTAASYQFEDLKPEIGTNYYRLAQYDRDGTVENSGVRTAEFSLNNIKVSVYPNPVSERLTLELPDFNAKTVNIALNDLQGKVLDAKSLVVEAQKAQYVLPKNISKGIYIIQVKGTQLNYSQKIEVR